MKIAIEQIPSYRIAYIRQTGPYGLSNKNIMEQLKSWARSNGLLGDQSIILGIARDNPQFTDPDHCRYDTCLVISDNYYIHEEYMKEGHIPGGEYAVFLIDHTAEAVQLAWQTIFPALLEKGYQMDETRFILERYKTELVKNHFCEICVPIQ